MAKNARRKSNDNNRKVFKKVTRKRGFGKEYRNTHTKGRDPSVLEYKNVHVCEK